MGVGGWGIVTPKAGKGGSVKTLSLGDAQDMLLGCTVLGTGGGGALGEGLALLESAA